MKHIYVVEDKDENLFYGVVAESRGKAKGIICNEFNDIEYMSLRCRIRRDLDEYAEKMLTGHIQHDVFCIEHDIYTYCEYSTCPNCGTDQVTIFKDKDGKIRCSACSETDWYEV